jgi:hypothetical protein
MYATPSRHELQSALEIQVWLAIADLQPKRAIRRLDHSHADLGRALRGLGSNEAGLEKAMKVESVDSDRPHLGVRGSAPSQLEDERKLREVDGAVVVAVLVVQGPTAGPSTCECIVDTRGEL